MTSEAMQFGLNITHDEGPDVDPARRLARQVEQARRARDCGFDFVSAGTRYSYGPARADERGVPLTKSRLQPLLLMSHLAGCVGTDIKYAITVVLASAVNPVQLAEDIATLDIVCAGGLRVGMGLGWHPYDLDAFNVARAGRTKRFEELVYLVTQLLTADSVSFEGLFFSAHDARLVARGVQRPRPPIWLGATVDAAIRRAARFGDAWTISSHHDVTELEGMLALYRAELTELGRPLPVEQPINRHVCIAEDRETALEDARERTATLYRERGKYGAPEQRVMDAAARGETPYIVGDPDDCAEQIAHVRDTLGVNVMYLGLSQGMDQETRLRTIELLGTKVLPQFG